MFLNKTISVVFFLIINLTFNVYAFENEGMHAYLAMVSGNEIYANAKMQAKVRLFYTPINNESLVFEFKQFGTGYPISSLGWNQSATDLGFDHNMAGLTRSFLQSKNSEQNYRDFYISANKSNSELTICVEISRIIKRKKKLLFSSCYDHGIDRGTVTLYSKIPPKFTEDDFIETEHIVAFSVKYENPDADQYTTKYKREIKGYVFGLQAKSTVPRDFVFSVLESNDFNIIRNDFYADNNKAFVYTTWYSYLSYKTRYFFKLPRNKKNIKFSVYDILGKKTGIYDVFSSGKEHIIDIMEVDFYNDSFLLDSRHCYDPNPSDLKVSYKCYSFNGTETTLPKNDETWDLMINKYSVMLKLQDNYGTVHKVRLAPYGW